MYRAGMVKMMPLRKAEGIVLRNRQLGEADKIITLFTREYGKTNMVAKGVRKAKSKLVGGTPIFTYGQYMYHQSRENKLGVLCQYALKEPFRALREDLKKLAAAAYVVELADEMLPEAEVNERAFILLLTTLHLLQSQDAAIVLRVYEMRLLAILGLQPHLEDCAECGLALERAGDFRFSPRLGGIVCQACARQDAFAMRLSRETVRMLQQFLRVNLQKLSILRPSPTAQREAERVLRAYISFQLEKKLKSIDFLRAVDEITTKGEMLDGNRPGEN